jgi:hypothetical protein
MWLGGGKEEEEDGEVKFISESPTIFNTHMQGLPPPTPA